ncbi:MAG: hypothetical protein LBR90_02555 [Elusimicrobiota bacterium]|jgi:dihydrofolate synthase/folylpolyglutamate synthase|nr:hypothetical protein [Elusimicrobiota bacterium]
MNFAQTLNLIQNTRGHGNKKNNLAQVKKTAALLGLKTLPCKIIHVAGTNGKGTTAALLALALKEAGFKTGLFTSPHIKDVRERIQINAAQISKKDFTRCVNAVLKKETAPLKFFEILTLAALLYFKESRAAFAVLEAGIGGKMDSTNIVSPALSAITSVSQDHQNILGRTLAQIARQKGGIIKPKTPALCGPLPPAAKKVIKQIAKAQAAPLKIMPAQKDKFLQNAALAFEAAQIFGVKAAQFKKALKNFKLPARFDVKKLGGRYVIIDGAHNPAALANFIKTYKNSPYYGPNNTLIYAASIDKDYKTAAKILAPHFKNVLLAQAAGPRSAPAEELKNCFKNAACLKAGPIRKKTLKNLNGNIIVLGSFYLAGQMPSLPS